MRRSKRQPLRGSVTQNNARVRMRPKEMTPLGFMLRLGALVGSVAVILGFAAWLWHIGWPQRQVEHVMQKGLQVTQAARFAVKDVSVEGRRQTSNEVLLNAIGIKMGDAIFSFDPAALQARIAKLPWIASVTVERFLPDTIYVRLTERQALARWQHEGKTVVIDGEGQELPGAQPEQFASLPLVVGSDAPQETKALLDTLKDYPAVTEKMTAARRVGERRWDLFLQQKTIARLPETGIEYALKQLSSLITDKKILERDVTAIDLRIPDKVIIESPHTTSPHTDGDMRL